MGNVCCNYDKVDFPAAAGEGTHRIAPEKELLSSSSSEMQDPREVNVLGQLGRSAIEDLIRQAQEALRDDGVRIPKNRLVNERFKLFDNEYTFWADFLDLPSGNKKHCYHHLLEYPFTPEMFFLFSLQQTLESFSKVDDSLDQLELLNFAALDDLIITVIKTKTKKILVVEPRSFLVLRVIKRVSPTHFIEAQKSVQLTGLKDQEPWKALLSKQQNLGEIEISAAEVKLDGGKVTAKSLNYVDVLSSTGPMILRPVLKGKFSRYHKNVVKETLKFLMRTKEADYRSLRWFTNDSAELGRIFAENRRIVAEKRPNLNDLEKSEADEVLRMVGELSAAGQNDKLAVTGEESLQVHKSGVAVEKKVSGEAFKELKAEPKEELKVEEKPASRKASELKAEPKVEEKPASRKASELKPEDKPASRKQSEKREEEVKPAPIIAEGLKKSEVSIDVPINVEDHVKALPEPVHEVHAKPIVVGHVAPANDVPPLPDHPREPEATHEPVHAEPAKEEAKPNLDQSNLTAATNATESQPIPHPEAHPDANAEANDGEGEGEGDADAKADDPAPQQGEKKKKKKKKNN